MGTMLETHVEFTCRWGFPMLGFMFLCSTRVYGFGDSGFGVYVGVLVQGPREVASSSLIRR